ncbi:MAG: hypothetical protein HRU17_23485 [Polyangiaceae bacterium]|nr:hypothetical protein [Polyangiaceae bacterium]
MLELHSLWSRSRGALALALALGSVCSGCASVLPPSPPATRGAAPGTSAAGADGPILPEGHFDGALLDSTLSDGAEMWRAAAADDPIDLGRLADREGATRLIACVQAGGGKGRVALRALPHTADVRSAVGELCSLLEHAAGRDQLLVLASLHQVLSGGIDGIDSDTAALCRGVLARVKPGLPVPADRDRVASALDSLSPRSAVTEAASVARPRE